MKNNLYFLIIALFVFNASIGVTAQAPYSIALLMDDLPGLDVSLSEKIEQHLLDQGFSIKRMDAQALQDKAELNTSRYDLLILPNAASLPYKSMPVIESYIQQSGDLLALNAPAFTQLLWRFGDAWLSEKDWRKRLAEVAPPKILFDFDDDDDDLSLWRRSSNTPDSPARHWLDDGVTGKALHVSVDNMTGWDTLSSPPLQNPFPPGHSLICFYAKGFGETRTLSLECTEKDGSRWIAVFPVAVNWTRIVLAPGDFHFWDSVKTRGGAGDRLNPQNVEYMRIGVAWTHTGPRGGKYEYGIDDLGTAPNPLGEKPGEWGSIPRLEGLCPSYKFYPLTDVASIKRSQSVIPFAASSTHQQVFSIPSRIQAHHPRPTGKGFNKDREWRWIPLLEAYGPNGEW
ncbi:MAG: hypothetical protein ACP5I1_03595, partial [Candidatus Hinthialibacter sp.]